MSEQTEQAEQQTAPAETAPGVVVEGQVHTGSNDRMTVTRANDGADDGSVRFDFH